MPSRGSAAADDLLPRVRASLDDSACVTRDTLAASGEAVAGAVEARIQESHIAVCHVPCELVESALFSETAAT